MPSTSHPFLARGTAPLNMAHRGGALEAPEETRAAFEHAAACGCEIFELDVHLTRDGAIVVHHDPTVDRTTNGTGPIAAQTLADLKNLDAGYHFEPLDAPGTFPYRGQGLRIVTLDAVMEAFPTHRLNLDLKIASTELLEKVLGLIDEHDAYERVCMASTADDHAGAKAMIDAVPETICRSFTGLAFLPLLLTLHAPRPVIPPYDVVQIPFELYGIPLLTPRNLKRLQALGLRVHAWTINAEEDMRRLIALGIDGIITDRPALLRKVLET